MNNGFQRVPLSEVLTHYQEYIAEPETKVYPKLSVKLYGKGVVLDASADGSTLKMRQHQIAKSGQVILSEIWGKKGAIGFVPPEGDGALCTSHFFLFDVHQDKIEPKYLQAIFTANYLEDQLNTEAKGTTGYAAVRPKHLLAARIPLPPLEEQRRIVARIEELAARIEEARGLRREAVLEAEKLLPSSITRVLKTIRGETKEVIAKEVAHSVTDGDHQPPPKADSGIPFIFISNVVGGKIDFSNCKWVSPEYFASIQPNRIPMRGDVLYTAVGATYGVPCLVDTDESFCFQRHIAIIKPDRSQILPKYLKWVLSSSDAYKQATKAVTGSAQPTVPLKGIRNLRFTLPSLQEQYRIVAYLDDLQVKVNCLKQLQSETSAGLDALLPSILDKAFKGKL